MMSNNISQAEIEALFGNAAAAAAVPPQASALSATEIDALGEVGNICMGTAATTLCEILNRRVTITAPKVSIVNLMDLANEFTMPYVIIQVSYTQGLEGINIMMLKEDDVRLITDIMMGGEGINNGEELGELHLSAISETMNMMMGSSATSMSDMLGRKIDISPPTSMVARINDDQIRSIFSDTADIIRVNFALTIEGLINSEIMQLMPVFFGKKLVDALMNPMPETPASPPPQQRPASTLAVSQAAPPRQKPDPAPPSQKPPFGHTGYNDNGPSGGREPVVDAKPMQFVNFDDDYSVPDAMEDSINLIIDVPMQVTIELGKCKKTVKEILDFNNGTILILDKLAGEPVEIVVNDKLIARGEVIQIDDNYGVRITEIINHRRSRGFN